MGFALGGQLRNGGLEFHADHDGQDRENSAVNLLKATTGEASMMARCTGKTNVHNLEPEDLRSITIATAQATGIPLAGTQWIPGPDNV